jgi:signal transduction histidine kinase
MNRLWVRLSLMFSLVVFVGLVIFVLGGLLIAKGDAWTPVVLDNLQSPGGLVEKLGNHYREHKSWDDLPAFMAESGEETEVAKLLNLNLHFTVIDSQGLIVYSFPYRPLGQRLVIEKSRAKVPIVVDNQLQGYVIIEYQPVSIQSRLPLLRSWLDEIKGSLLAVVFTIGSACTLAGMLMSRSLTAPLSRLSEAARAIGTQDLARRVKVEGTIEVASLARALNEMVAALEQTERLRRNLVADVAHELRTPLTVLQGNLMAVIDDIYPLEKAEITRLYEQTRLLSRLVEDLHELSQAEAKQLPLNLRPVHMDKLIETVVTTFEPLAQTRSVLLQVEILPNLPRVWGDSARLSQVLHNILNNALAHTPSGGRISIRAMCHADMLSLSIQDTGEGIPTEYLPYVFERFYRADRSRTRHTGGTGLGLAITKAIVETHAGSITAASEGIPGQGSTFTIELPLANSENIRTERGE